MDISHCRGDSGPFEGSNWFNKTHPIHKPLKPRGYVAPFVLENRVTAPRHDRLATEHTARLAKSAEELGLIGHLKIILEVPKVTAMFTNRSLLLPFVD